TGRPLPHPGNGQAQPPQQYHHHQHHYNGSAAGSPPTYASLPHPTSIAGVNSSNTSQVRRAQVNYKTGNGSETVALQPRPSPKNSPGLEPESYQAKNGQMRKLTSFSNSSASGGHGESNDTTPTQQSFGGLLTPGGQPNALTASASSSSREMTPISNASS